MATQRALIIDDEPDIRELLSLTLERMDIDCDTAANLGEANDFLAKGAYNLCLTDMKLPDGNGLDLVKKIQESYANLPVAVITAYGSMDIAIEAMKAGAFDFISKPIDLGSLRSLITKALASSEIPEDSDEENKTRLIGVSSSIKNLIKSINKLARSQAPVYISGESGSGKELVARSIHELGPRKDKEFVPVNCGAIPSELMESEFFGHKKGSFTGASHDKQGLFQAAEGGTLFLDEVADLPIDMQVKLLRAIQEKAVRPVGSQAEMKTDVRVLSATHKNLEELVRQGEFRQDLFYRLNVIQLAVPPLRKRMDDLPLLVESILARIAEVHGMDKPKVTKSAFKALTTYEFPGNIRELENILERAFTLCEGDEISDEDLQLDATSSAVERPRPANGGLTNHYQSSQNHTSIDEYLAEVEREIICETLENVRWNKTLAAKKLGISFRSLRYRLVKLGFGDDE